MPSTSLCTRLFVCSALLACSAARAPSALAQARAATPDPDADARARDLFEQGRAAYQDARYEEALDLFTRAYALSKRPQLLNNIAQAADRLRLDAQALNAYERYLAEVPDAENRPAVENRIAALKSVLESQREVPTPAQTARAAEPAPVPQTAAAPAATAPRDEDDGSVLSSWWLWAGIGAAAVAGVIIGVAASSGTETVEGSTPVVNGATRVIEL